MRSKHAATWRGRHVVITGGSSGTVKPMSADAVATAIVRGMDRRAFAIYANAEMRLLAAIAPPLAPVVRRYVDRKVARARRGNG